MRQFDFFCHLGMQMVWGLRAQSFLLSVLTRNNNESLITMQENMFQYVIQMHCLLGWLYYYQGNHGNNIIFVLKIYSKGISEWNRVEKRGFGFRPKECLGSICVFLEKNLFYLIKYEIVLLYIYTYVYYIRIYSYGTLSIYNT